MKYELDDRMMTLARGGLAIRNFGKFPKGPQFLIHYVNGSLGPLGSVWAP